MIQPKEPSREAMEIASEERQDDALRNHLARRIDAALSSKQAEIDDQQKEIEGAEKASRELNRLIDAKQAEIDQLKFEVAAKQGYIERLESVNDGAAEKLETARAVLLPLVQLANGWTSRLDKLKDASAIYDEGEGRTYYAGQLRAARAFLASLTAADPDQKKAESTGLSVEEARRRGVCRVCWQSITISESYIPNEFAHTTCLEQQVYAAQRQELMEKGMKLIAPSKYQSGCTDCGE